MSEDPVKQSTFPLIHRILFTQMFRLGSPANYTPSPEESISAMAQNLCVTPQEMAYDILLENQGCGFIYAPLVNYANYTMDACAEMLDDTYSIMGLGDGGGGRGSNGGGGGMRYAAAPPPSPMSGDNGHGQH